MSVGRVSAKGPTTRKETRAMGHPGLRIADFGEKITGAASSNLLVEQLEKVLAVPGFRSRL